MRGVKVLVAVVVVALLGASAAFAATAFEDVPEGAFYDEPTAWAVEQGLTVGCDRAAGQAVSDTFCPLANVSRGENITFTYRHQTLVIDPLLDEIRGEIDALEETLATNTGEQGPKGDTGDTGPAGPPGEDGVDGVDGVDADPPAQVVTVETDGGDYGSLSAALASITDASKSNPYLVRIGEGTFTESAKVELKDYVDVEGAGEDLTTVTCACNDSSTLQAGNIVTEVRYLTIENTGTGTIAGFYAVEEEPPEPPAEPKSATDTTEGAASSVPNSFATVSLRDATVSAAQGSTCHAVRADRSSMTMTNVTATASGCATENAGVYNFNGQNNPDLPSPIMTNVFASGSGSLGSSGYGVFNYGASPTMTNVVALATNDDNSIDSFGSSNVGVVNFSGASSLMMNVTASAFGGYSPEGILNNNFSEPHMFNVTATAWGGFGGRAHAVKNVDSSPTIVNLTAVARGINSYGVENKKQSSSGTGSSPTIDASSIRADFRSVSSTDADVPAIITGSVLEGTVGTFSGAEPVCSFSYNELDELLESDCQPPP